MLLIKTKVRDSHIHGLGLFTKESLDKGQIVWKMSHYDVHIYSDTYQKLKALELTEFIDTYASIQNANTGYMFLDGDDCRFMNHSDQPNVMFIDNLGVVTRDVDRGDELTCDYYKITTKEHANKLLNR